MTSRTKSLARRVHTALMTLDPPTLFTLIETALTELLPEDIEMADNLRFRLGWLLQDDQGHQHTTWPNDTPQSVDWVEWVDPDPNTLAHTLAHTDVITFYHEILPVFATYPSLDAMPPSVASDGYRWMQALASWIRSYPDNLRETICPADSPRMTTADIAAGLPLPVGDCGDAWTLRAVGDPLDVIDHRPYAGHKRTPIGLCADAPLLILYPERGAVDWPALFHPISLTNGVLFSGAPVWIVPLTPSQRTHLQTRRSVTLANLIAIASVSTP